MWLCHDAAFRGKGRPVGAHRPHLAVGTRGSRGRCLAALGRTGGLAPWRQLATCVCAPHQPWSLMSGCDHQGARCSAGRAPPAYPLLFLCPPSGGGPAARRWSAPWRRGALLSGGRLPWSPPAFCRLVFTWCGPLLQQRAERSLGCQTVLTNDGRGDTSLNPPFPVMHMRRVYVAVAQAKLMSPCACLGCNCSCVAACYR